MAIRNWKDINTIFAPVIIAGEDEAMYAYEGMMTSSWKHH